MNIMITIMIILITVDADLDSEYRRIEELFTTMKKKGNEKKN